MKNLNLQEYKKIMLIVWKWKHPKSNNQLKDDYDAWRIQHEPDALIIRFDPKWLMSGVEYDPFMTGTEIDASLETIKQILKSKNSNCDVQIYLHSSHGYLQEIVDAQNTDAQTQRITYYLFQHGSSVLYVSPENNEGLLGLDGDWGKPRDTEGKRRYVASESNQTVLKENFQFVWDFHAKQLPEDMHRLNEDIVRGLLPYTVMKRAPEKEIIQAIEIQTNYFLKKHRPNISAPLLNRLELFSKNLQASTFNQQELLDLRNQFNESLNEFKGDRIYA